MTTVLVSSVLAACSGENDTEPSAAFWPDGVSTEWVEVRDCRLSPAEHDGYSIRVLAPPDQAADYLEDRFPLPTGTQLVKLEYEGSNCTDLARISAMRKLEADEAPGSFDWEWLRTTPEGKKTSDWEERSCAGCHMACADRDYTCTEP